MRHAGQKWLSPSARRRVLGCLLTGIQLAAVLHLAVVRHEVCPDGDGEVDVPAAVAGTPAQATEAADDAVSTGAPHFEGHAHCLAVCTRRAVATPPPRLALRVEVEVQQANRRSELAHGQEQLLANAPKQSPPTAG